MEVCKEEQRVCRQFIEAALYERLVTFQETPLKNGMILFEIALKNGRIECHGKRGAFDRIRIEPGSIMVSRQRYRSPLLLNNLIEEFELSATLSHELQQTLDLSKWNDRNLMQPESRRNLSYEELESALVEGHPYHPCYKSRTGFSVSDHEAYGPEAGQSFGLVWVACRKENTRSTVLNDKAFWRNELGLDYLMLLERMTLLGLEKEHYVIAPVHPWQWEHIEGKLKEEAVYLGRAGGSFRATQSVRTLWNEHDPAKPHLKLAMSIAHTSSVRTLDPPAVAAAPAISAWLSQLVQRDDLLSERLIILEEFAGVCYEPEDEGKSGEIAAIWRESVRSKVKDDERAVPMNACSLIEKDDQIFISEWLEQYGVDTWVNQLIQVLVIPVWHLLVKHGVGLEAHAQNVVLIHQDGWPVRVALRDFHDSVEYVEDFLADKEAVPDFREIHPAFQEAAIDQYYWMSSVEGLRELVMDTLFVFHLTELSNVLEQQGWLEESSFWSLVYNALNQYERDHPELAERMAQVGGMEEFIQAEALLARKMAADHAGSHRIRNSISKEENRCFT